MDVGEDACTCLANAAGGIIDEGGVDADVDVEWGGVCEIAEAGVVGKHRMDGAVILEDGGFAEGGLLEGDGDLVFVVDLVSVCGVDGLSDECVGGGGGEAGCRCESGARAGEGNFGRAADDDGVHLVDDCGDIVVHELVEGLDLVCNDLFSIELLEVIVEDVLV